MVKILEDFKDAYTSKETVLKKSDISKICNKVVDAVKNELPEEAQTIEVFNYILEESKKMLHSKTVKLE